MPFGFGSSKKMNDLFTTNIKDREEISEITKIAEMLNPDEKVLLVAKQSRIKPGGSYITPNTVYATDRRIIIRDPYVLGLRENIVDIPYDIITGKDSLSLCKVKYVSKEICPSRGNIE
ncbi:MAG: PH domain-containing protein [Nitrososphaeraceae archaeon]